MRFRQLYIPSSMASAFGATRTPEDGRLAPRASHSATTALLASALSAVSVWRVDPLMTGGAPTAMKLGPAQAEGAWRSRW